MKLSKNRNSQGKQVILDFGKGETLKAQHGYNKSDTTMDNPKWVKTQNDTFRKKMDELFTFIAKNGYPKKETENPLEYQMYSRLNHLSSRPDLMDLLSDKQFKVVAERPVNRIIVSKSKSNLVMAKAKKSTGGKKVTPMKPVKVTPTRVAKVSQKANQNRIKEISKLATTIQDGAGFRTVTKKVHLMNRSVAVKKAWDKLKK